MWRIQVAFVLIAGAFVLTVIRLFYWQIVRGEELRREASAQYNLSFALPAARGSILSSDGSPFAMNVPAHLVFAQPAHIENAANFATLVAPILLLEEEDVYRQITQEGRFWVPLARKADEETVAKLKALELKGLGFESVSTRYYPEASMAAQMLGFVGLDQNGLDKGYFGLEGYYDRELRGKDGRLEIEKDVRGAPILVGEQTRIAAQDGRDVTLWVDRSFQQIVQKRLAEGIEKYGAKEGSVVAIDPKTGGILAMASYPDYIPAQYASFNRELYKNPIVASTYEPGSTFKVIVMAAALNEKAVTATTTFDESGPLKVGEYAIRTWNGQYRGKQTMTEVIQHSSNVGMVYAATKLGQEKLLQYIRDAGFGSLTGVDLEDETASSLRDEREWREIDYATASFGQGIAVTPIQMVRAVAAIANGGWLMEPHVVKSIVDTKGKVVDIKPKQVRQLFSREASEIMTEMMINAVDNGEAKWAKPKGYRIAGKTGTAQIPVAGHYDATKTIASFVGFAPADNPQFVMLVTLREPTSSPWGSETAAPLFFNIARDVFLYKNIFPDS
jgi:stage V sporulation protein D (sporulation-specific penicillin-binding protein)